MLTLTSVRILSSAKDFDLGQKEQLVGDGEIGERSLIAWAADSIRNDPYESCIEDVINKAASDSDDVKFFIDALDNSAFKKTRKRKR